MSRATQLRAALRAHGVGGVLERLAERAAGRRLTVRRLLFFEFDLARPLPALSARLPLEIRVATRDDLTAYAPELTASRGDPGKLRMSLDRGDTPVLALVGSAVVHVQWITVAPMWLAEVGVAMMLAPGEAYLYSAVTFGQWRGHGIHPAVNSFIKNHLRERGCSREILYVDSRNERSLKTQAKLGCAQTKVLWSFTLRGREQPSVVLGVTRSPSPSLSRSPRDAIPRHE